MKNYNRGPGYRQSECGWYGFKKINFMSTRVLRLRNPGPQNEYPRDPAIERIWNPER